MSTLNRRAILAGAATVAAVVQPGAVRIANARPVELIVGDGAGPAHAELQLFEIEQEVRDLDLKIKVAGDAWDVVQNADIEWKRQNPKPAEPSATGDLPAGWRERGAQIIKEGDSTFRDLCDAIFEPKNQDRARQKAEYVEALAQWEARYAAALDEIGYSAAQDTYEGLIDDQDALFEEAADIRSVTFAGIQCKARLAKAWDPSQVNTPALANNLIDDLLAMQVQA